MKHTHTVALIPTAFPLMGVATAEVPTESGFIDDLPALQVNPEDPDLFEWKSGASPSDYPRLMVPQPEIFLDEDNKYRGIQPDQMKAIADDIAEDILTRFDGTLELVGEPGPGVFVLYMALTNLEMKKKRSLFGYLPTGALVHAATAQRKVADLDALAKKINMVNARLEVEAVDGASGKRLGVAILNIAGKQKGREEKSWEALEQEMDDLADRFYKNYQARVAEQQAAQD